MNEERASIGEIAAWSIGTAIVAFLIGYLAYSAFIFAGKSIALMTGETVDLQAESDCIQWAAEAKRHTAYSEQNPGGYYLLKWQKEECDSVNVHVEAPVI